MGIESVNGRIFNEFKIRKVTKDDEPHIIAILVDDSVIDIPVSNLLDQMVEPKGRLLDQSLPEGFQSILADVMRYNAEHPEKLVEIYTELENQGGEG